MDERSIMYKMIRAEYERLTKEIKEIQSRMEGLAEGSFKIVKKKYVYLSFRNAEGIACTKYAGRLEDAGNNVLDKGNVKTLDMYMTEIQERRFYETILKGLKESRKEMEAYLKAGDRYYKKRKKRNEKSEE